MHCMQHIIASMHFVFKVEHLTTLLALDLLKLHDFLKIPTGLCPLVRVLQSCFCGMGRELT